MHLTFSHGGLAALLAEAERQWPLGIRQRYGLKDPAGFWLVGDHGVHLMHNGAAVAGEKQPTVHANECNPETSSDWWEVKRATFGGDDGCELIDADMIRNAVRIGADLRVSFTETSMTVDAVANPTPAWRN